MTPRFQNLNDLDREAVRLFEAGEMTEARYRELLKAGIALGYSTEDMDFLIGSGKVEWLMRLSAELEAEQLKAG